VTKPENRPRVLLADDSPRVVESVSELLSEDFLVVGTVSDGLHVPDAVEKNAPDVIVMDIGMPGMDGIRTAKVLREMGSPAKIVFLTISQDEDYIAAALAAGAVGYVLKARMRSDLVPALREALAGRICVWRKPDPAPEY
jgi:two-component system secretion response regulator SsrB